MSRRALTHSLLLLVLASPVAAQDQVIAQASLPVASPTGGGVRNLLLGQTSPIAGQTIVVDVPAAVAPQSATLQAGEFRFNVSGAAGIDFNLSLPAALNSTIGTATLPISFAGAQYGGRCIESATVTCALTSFDPTAGTERICRTYNGGSGTCRNSSIFPAGTFARVFLGGRISVPANQAAATYSGTVTLTISQVH